MFHDVVRVAVTWVAVGSAVIVSALFLLTQAFLVNHEYHSLLVQRDNDAWLLQQCRFDEFYHRLGHHSRLCDEVAAKQMDPVWLEALRNVVGRAFLCGERSCMEMTKDAMDWAAGPGIFLSMFICLLILTIPTLLVPVINDYQRADIMRRREDAIHKRLA